jgi:putative zinc finger/helix-turn-helix YgiT family protein
VVETTCPICGKGRLAEHRGTFETKYFDRRGVEQLLKLTDLARLQCDSCGEEILDDFASGQVEDARRTAIGLLSSAEIRDLRLRFGKTQTQMSELLGIGKKTYCRWESGAFVQSVAFDNYLRLIRDIPEASAMLICLEVDEHARRAADPTAGSDLEFEFLGNIAGANDSAEKFTHLMLAGMLHVPGEADVQAGR